ncbi:MAG: hypothetical protein ACO3Z6_00820 [Pseudomonadales bacterium]
MAYVGAVSIHLGRDGGRAALYTVFWSELRTIATQPGQAQSPTSNQLPGSAQDQNGALAAVPPERWAQLRDTVSKVAARTLADSDGPADTPDVRPVGSALRLGLQALAQHSEFAAAERVLKNVDKTLAPRVEIQGRYEFAGSLEGAADLGFSSEVWLLCRTSMDCVRIHDELFAPTMSGVGLLASAEERLRQDARAAADPMIGHLLGAANDLDARLRSATDPEAVRAAAATAARDYWRQITSRLPLPDAAGLSRASLPMPGTPSSEQPSAGAYAAGSDAQGIGALIEAGRVSAQIAGQPDLANVFTVTRAPVLEFTSALTQGALVGTLGAGVATAGLLFAGVQALALFDNDANPGSLPPDLERLVTALSAASAAGPNAATLRATQVLDARVANLGAAVEILRTDVERLESAGRRRIAADYQSAAARRATAFETENERCFGLRYRNPANGRLPPSALRRCEDRLLQGALRGAQYAIRSSEYLLDARFLAAGDAQFPFHDHYPLLAARSGLDTRAALALVDPLDWQQYAAALMRLYQEHPAGVSERARRRETLQSVQAAGGRTAQTLAMLIEVRGTDGRFAPRTDLQAALLTAYKQSLEALLARIDALDQPDRHPYGKRVTEDLDQPPPMGAQRAAANAVIGAAPLASCYDRPADAFAPETARLVTESRRFFGNPIEPAEVQAAWQRGTVDTFAFTLPDPVELVPTPFLWAALEGLGRLEFCLAELRPAALAFTRTPGLSEDTFLGSTLIRAALEVRFTPDPARVPGALEAHPITVARYTGERSCRFDYHADEKPCSRAQCLATLAPTLWQDQTASTAMCEGAPLVSQLRPATSAALPSAADADEMADTTALRAILTTAWQIAEQPRREQLLADVRRSNEYDAASSLYLELHALSHLTLGYASEQRLNGMFAAAAALPGSSDSGAFSPLDVLQLITAEGLTTATAARRVHARIERVLASIGEDARAMSASAEPGARPPLEALRETLTRLELASAAYGG